MKTVQELHIAVQQKLQKADSNAYIDLEPFQIDWFLNVGQKRLLKQKLYPQKEDNNSLNFYAEQRNVDYLQNLIISDYELNTFIDFKNISPINKYKAFATLPENYFSLINDKSIIYENCNQSTTIIQEVIDAPEYIYVFPLNSNPSFSSLTVVIDATSIFSTVDTSQITYNGSVFNSIEYKFYVINILLYFVNRNLKESLPNKLIKGLYWESYDNINKNNSFILVSEEPLNTNSINICNSPTLITRSNFKKTNKATGLIEVSNRLIKQQFKADVLNNNSFYKTIPKSPITVLTNDKIEVFYNKNFIVKKIVIDYIRNPRYICYYQNITTEFNSNLAEELTDITVEYIKLVLSDPNWKNFVQDNMLNKN